MKLTCNPKSGSYPIYMERGLIEQASSLIPSHPNTVIVTDSGVPRPWVDAVQKQFDATVITFPQGEASKSFETLESVLSQIADAGLTRKDAVIAVGGGVVGDLAGLCAALYMRGIDFYNIPTTVLSQVDSSVGGKTAIDLGNFKNLVGAFWQPKAVLIDPDVLETLSDRHIANGLVEALKMGLILDESLVDEFEKETMDLDKIILRSIELKRDIVEADEKEQGCRALLNFGHTIGHALEGANGFSSLHGECVGYGMLYMMEDDKLKVRVKAILDRLNIPEPATQDKETLLDFMRHDKKSQADGIKTVHVTKPGQAEIKVMTLDQLEALL